MITEFQELIDSDPLVRMYVNQMIAEVPTTKPYRKQHLESVDQLLLLINEVLTMTPEFGRNGGDAAGAILDWTMGTPAGFAAYRDPRINAMLNKILTAWSEFLSSSDSLYVLDDSPSGWKSAEAQRAVGIEQFEYEPAGRALGLCLMERFLHPMPNRAARIPQGRKNGSKSRRARALTSASRPGRFTPKLGAVLE